MAWTNAEVSLSLAVEITYDWILILIQIWFMILHYIRMRIQYSRASAEKRTTMFNRLNTRTLSIGLLIFALFVVINRFFGIVGLYGTSLKSCDIYLIFAVIFTVLHKTCNYQFILFRLKSQLEYQSNNSNGNSKQNKLKWIGFYIFSIIIIIFALCFIIFAIIIDPLAEIDDNRCNFSADALKNFVPIYGGIDFVYSVIFLLLFAFGIWRYRNIEKSVKQTLNRIIKWSVIAILSTFISTIIASLVDGASPIFLVGDVVINSICAVMQFQPINKDLNLPYKQQWKIFCETTKIQFGNKENNIGDMNEDDENMGLDGDKDDTNFGIGKKNDDSILNMETSELAEDCVR